MSTPASEPDFNDDPRDFASERGGVSPTVVPEPAFNGDPRSDASYGATDLKRIDALCEQFERSWQAGSPIALKSLIAGGDAAVSRLLFRELLAVEVEYRALRGEPLSQQCLCEEFPDYKDVIALVIDESLVPAASSEDAVPAWLERHPRYEITGRLGMGGMGTVYSGRHTVLGRDVAIKIIRHDFLTAPGARERFLREARTAALVQHPNVVAVYDAEATDEGQFLVMEAVSGADLAKTVAEHGPLPWDAACDAIHQAAQGLEAGRRIGMVHRDLSPRNLMLADDGTVKLLDFGLASLSSAVGDDDQLLCKGMLVGSAAFVSPEQVDDPASSDVRSDLYSLGCVMYFLLTGRPPFPITSLPELLDAHRHQPAPAVNVACPDIPAAVTAIVARLLAKVPGERFQTPAALAAALEPFCTRALAAASMGTETAVPSPPKSQRPRSRLSALLGIVLLGTSERGGVSPSAERLIALLAVVLFATAIALGFREYRGRGGPQAAAVESPEFIQGLSLLGQRQERQVRRAIDRFQQVVAREPKHARALAALAEAYNLCGDYGWDLPELAFPRAIAAAGRALELNPNLAEGRLALAFAAATYTCDWPDAERQYQLALEAAPELPSAHHWYAWLLLQQRRFDEALAEIERAQQLAPDNLIIANNVGKILYFSRKYITAAEKHRAALDLDQDFQKAHRDLGYTLIELGQIDEALLEFDRSAGISTGDWDVQAARAYALARQGKPDAVRPILQSLEPVAAKEGLSMEMAHIYAALGEVDRSFEWLNATFARKSSGRADIAVDPRLDAIRTDPRFPPLLKSIGLSTQ